MAKRKIQKPTRFERMYKVWDYLRKNTDRRHPTSIAKMRKDENINAYIGDKETINRLLKDMANIMNLEDGGSIMNLEDGGSDYKPEAECCILMISKSFMVTRNDMNEMILMKMILILQM